MDNFAIFPNIILGSLYNLLAQFVSIVPNIIAALVVFIFGLFVAEAAGRLVKKLLHRLYFDTAVSKSGSKKVLEKVGFKYDISKFIGLLVTWFLYLVFLIAIADILGLPQITEFLKSIVLYIPNVVVAVVILIVGILISDLARKIVVSAMHAHALPNAKFVSALARWSILIFSVMATLVHLKVATELITILFSGFVFMVSLAGGIAFGFGGKESASELLKSISRK